MQVATLPPFARIAIYAIRIYRQPYISRRGEADTRYLFSGHKGDLLQFAACRVIPPHPVTAAGKQYDLLFLVIHAGMGKGRSHPPGNIHRQNSDPVTGIGIPESRSCAEEQHFIVSHDRTEHMQRQAGKNDADKLVFTAVIPDQPFIRTNPDIGMAVFRQKKNIITGNRAGIIFIIEIRHDPLPVETVQPEIRPDPDHSLMVCQDAIDRRLRETVFQGYLFKIIAWRNCLCRKYT